MILSSIRKRLGPAAAAAAICVITLTVPGPGAAQEGAGREQRVAEPDSAVVVLPEVRVRVLLAEQVQHTPGAASILTTSELQRLRPYTLHDALDFVPGVRTIDDDVLGLHTGIGIRGAPPRRSRKTLLLEDGSPINQSAYLDAGSRYTPPMERLERIEVLRGAGQLVHGPLNNHGIINFRNRRATQTPETTLELGGGELSSFRRHALHTRTLGAVGTVLSYTGMNADGAFDIESHQFDDLYGSLEWALDPRQTLTTSYTYFRQRTDGYDESNLTPAQFALHPRSKLALNQAREFNNTSVNYLKGDLTHEVELAGGARLATKAFATELDRPRFQTRGVAPSEGGLMEGRVRVYRTGGVESRLQLAPLERLGVRHLWKAGVRYERNVFDDGRPVGRPGEALTERVRGNVFAVAGVDGYTRDGRLITYGANAYSLFLQDAIHLRDWILTPGVRLETYSQARNTVFRPGHPEEGTTEAEHHTLLLPGVSLLYQGSDRTQIYAGVHRGFAPANARTDEFPLEPETGVNAQLGVRSAHAGMTFDAAAFYNRILNTLIRDDVDHFGDALFVNSADSRAYGVDLSAAAASAGMSRGAPGIFGQIAYNYTLAEFVTPPLRGNRVPEIAEHVGSVTVGLGTADRWQLSATVSHFGDFFADKENTTGLHVDGGQVPARTLLGARARYGLPAAVSASLWVQGRNLTNRLYVSDVQDGLRPGAPRSVMAGIRVGF
jgi:Fe(3+) dicitrate transport protein